MPTKSNRARKPNQERWVTETLNERRGVRVSYRATEVLRKENTGQQNLVFFRSPHFREMLALDGAIQITAADEFMYQEMMTHVPLFAHGGARQVLIIGGGDCGIARQVLRHNSVQRLVQVEIDPSVVKFSKKHFPQLTGPVFADKRFELIIEDGMKFVAITGEQFDVIIVDSTDPQGPGKVLFSYKFYSACKRCLKRGGVLVTQNGVPFLQADELASSVAHFRKLFRDGSCYIAAIPSYFGGHMAMGWATDNTRLRRLSPQTITTRYATAGRFSTGYWTPEVHRAAFALPRFISDTIGEIS